MPLMQNTYLGVKTNLLESSCFGDGSFMFGGIYDIWGLSPPKLPRLCSLCYIGLGLINLSAVFVAGTRE